MTTKLSKLSVSEIFSVCDTMRHDSYIDSLDRAELTRHFGGGELAPGCDNLGLVGTTNWLMGYKYLNKAFQGLFGLYTGDAGIAKITVKKAISPDRRRLVERVANRRVNQVIKESRRFRYNYWSACGDAVLYGSPYMYRWDKHDWCPLYGGIPLMPRNAPADVGDPTFVRWAYSGELSGADIMAQLKRAERAQSSPWDIKGLRAALKQLIDELKPDGDHIYNYNPDEDDPEKIEMRLQTNQILEEVLGASVKVYFFYQKRPDGKIDCYIVNRLDESVNVNMNTESANMAVKRKGGADRAMMFYQAARFDSVHECLFPLTLDIKFGGKALAHRVMGLGRLNYDLDTRVSELINSGMAGLEDDFSPLYQAQDASSLVKLEQMMASGIRRGSVFPPGVTAFERPKNQRNFGNLFSFMQLMDGAEGQNAASQGANAGSGKGRSELEVQALERQNENQANITSRMADWVEMCTPMLKEMIFTLVGRGKMASGDRGWPERKKLQELLEEDGILIEELDPSLITVETRQHLGQGDNALRLQRAERKLSILQLLPPESHKTVVREYIEALDNSYERANELVPVEEVPNKNQMQKAQAQTSYSLATGTPAPVDGDDIPELHAQMHLQAAAAVIQANQEGGLDPSLTNGFSGLLEHTQADIQMIGIKGNTQLADQLMQGLVELAKAGQELARPAAPPKEEVELELKQRNQQLSEQKHQDALAKQAEQQALKEKNAAFNEEARLAQLALQERQVVVQEEGAIDNRLEAANSAQ